MGRLAILAHVLVEKAPLYRAVMQVFVQARNRYEVYRRPSEVVAGLREQGYPLTPEEEANLELSLEQLVRWGNLSRTQQTGGARSLEEWSQRRFLYQVTTAGERAEYHLDELMRSLDDQGSLQGVMLRSVRDNLEALAAQVAGGHGDADVLYRLLDSLHGQFTSLTQNASAFLTTVSRALDATQVDSTAFNAYKLSVLTYIDGFIDEMQRLAPPIAAAIASIEKADLTELFRLAASANRTPDLGGGVRDESAAFAAQWQGLRRWFVGGPGEEPRSEALKREARAAVQRVLNILHRLGDARSGRISRRSDLVALARRFDACRTDADAHSLFKATFALYGARHLAVVAGEVELDEQVLEQPRESWWETSPVEVPLRLRETGPYSRVGRSARVEDFSRGKERLKEKAVQLRDQRDQALRSLVGRGAFSLAELGLLHGGEFRSLTEMLALAISRPRRKGQPISVPTRDGRLTITVVWPDGAAWTVLETSFGRLRLPDYLVEVSPGARRVHKESLAG